MWRHPAIGAYPDIPGHKVSRGGPNIRSLRITSEKTTCYGYYDYQYYGYEEREKEVRSQLESEINGGQWNIVAVKTSYASGYLLNAEIIHDASGAGEGNKLRVMFIFSDKLFWHEKMREIEGALNEVTGSGMYDILKVQKVFTRGYLLAAEVYHQSP